MRVTAGGCCGSRRQRMIFFLLSFFMHYNEILLYRPDKGWKVCLFDPIYAMQTKREVWQIDFSTPLRRTCTVGRLYPSFNIFRIKHWATLQKRTNFSRQMCHNMPQYNYVLHVVSTAFRIIARRRKPWLSRRFSETLGPPRFTRKGTFLLFVGCSEEKSCVPSWILQDNGLYNDVILM